MYRPLPSPPARSRRHSGFRCSCRLYLSTESAGSSSVSLKSVMISTFAGVTSGVRSGNIAPIDRFQHCWTSNYTHHKGYSHWFILGKEKTVCNRISIRRPLNKTHWLVFSNIHLKDGPQDVIGCWSIMVPGKSHNVPKKIENRIIGYSFSGKSTRIHKIRKNDHLSKKSISNKSNFSCDWNLTIAIKL